MPSTAAQHDAPAAKPAPERRAADSLPAAFLLALTGGFLDAFLYLDHGRVFAGAMTGNAVLFGMTLFQGSGLETLRHALPLLAFGAGVWLAELLQNRIKHHAVTLALACEAGGLLVASFLPRRFPDAVFIFAICLLAAFQIATFRKAGEYSYNFTFITGDLRTTLIALYNAMNPAKRGEALRQARELGSLFLCFLMGAVLGASCTRHLGNHALWLPCIALLVVFAMALRRSLEPAAGKL